jgi:hypothetical protein
MMGERGYVEVNNLYIVVNYLWRRKYNNNYIIN